MGLIITNNMNKVILLLVLFIAMPLFSYCQNKMDKINTKSTFADYGFYNEQNNHILFIGIDLDTVINSFKTSIKLKNIDNDIETVIVPDIQLSLPSFGWLDSSHVFYTTSESIGEPKIFGPWQGYFIKYNIFTQKEDTITSPWYSSDNHVDNINSSTNRLFYTIVFDPKDDVVYWNEYLIESEEIKTIKKYKNGSDNRFRILTYQYLPNSKEIIYIKENSKRREFIKFSTIDGKEHVIKLMELGNSIEASVLKGNKLYYLERISSENEYPDLRNFSFVIKFIDINTKRIETVYTFEEGIEVSNISVFKKNKLLVSVQENLNEAIAEKSINIESGIPININVGLDVASYLFIVDVE